MAEKDFYAVMIPYVKVSGKRPKEAEAKKAFKNNTEQDTDVMKLANGLRKRLLEKPARVEKTHGTVLELGATTGKSAVASVADKLTKDAVLYVTAHGNTSVIGTAASNLDQGWGKDISASDLVRDVNLHVPKTLGHLKIMTCHSGSKGSEDARFVKAVAEGLADQGFNDLVVNGYCGYTGERFSHSYVTEFLSDNNEQKDQPQFRAKECRIAFKGSEQVEVPAHDFGIPD